ncbi:MAG: CoA-binding protein [Desulfovibrionales bacterium]
MLHDQELLRALSQVKTVAVVGAKDKPSPVDRVGRYLLEAGFNVYPVHPKRSTVWGLPVYPSLLEIPHPIDLVDIFRAPVHCPDHAEECLQLAPPPRIFWMQSGISSSRAREILSGSPTLVVEDRCLMLEHQRLVVGTEK